MIIIDEVETYQITSIEMENIFILCLLLWKCASISTINSIMNFNHVRRIESIWVWLLGEKCLTKIVSWNIHVLSNAFFWDRRWFFFQHECFYRYFERVWFFLAENQWAWSIFNFKSKFTLESLFEQRKWIRNHNLQPNMAYNPNVIFDAKFNYWISKSITIQNAISPH